MSWLSSFLLGRPGNEISFDVNPEAMQIDDGGIVVRQRNLAGDLKKSTFKTSCPVIRVNSSYLTLAQRNQFNSLVGVADTFLSFQTRNDWQQIDDLATVLSTTTLQLQNSSALRLSAILAGAGLASVITINSIIIPPTYLGFGLGPFGAGGFGDTSGTYDPGTITYDDVTRIITVQNTLPVGYTGLFVKYTYKGWLVDMEKFSFAAQGGWLDRFTYDFQLTGA